MPNIMNFSLPKSGDLIIGQKFLFTVEILSDDDISDDATISFYNNKNIITPLNTLPLAINNDKKKAVLTVALTVNNFVSENEEIYFSVKTSLNYIKSQTLIYRARTISFNSLRLNVDNIFLKVPMSFNISKIGNILTNVHTIIRDHNGNTLSGVPVFVKSNANNQLKELFVLDSDEKKEIIINKFDGYDGFFVNSNDKGKVEFVIAPKKSLSQVIELSSIIKNATDFVPSKNPIFITVDNTQNNRQPLNIITAIGGNLKSEGESKFWVDMSPCEDYKLGDFLLFFVNNKYKHYTRILGKAKLDSCLKELPYFIFRQNELSKLDYLLLASDGDTLVKSSPADVTYRGRPNKPWTDVDRGYEPCQVYSSFNKLIKQGEVIINDTISNHDHNSDDAGLFVRIIGTNDNNDVTKAKFGSEIILTLYINSNNKTITQTFKQQIPYQPDKPGGKTVVLTFNIPYDFLSVNYSFFTHDAEIFFDYQIGDDKDRDVTYGGIWSGFIDTP
ncbi:hypothetical protein FE392_08135 [Xenorhabdus sp. 12]|uniref:Inverse autotransporter beta-domain domain-containing protein n=1 Tax=Xenorhabdus santafensis TaxID=2582833 RepID=A0ABU4S922_9GAMM|nr:hypothetical protein [Xenorhabdus sp. 12]MDX7987299.1 hypothetical protein [Xenorhabdus sp. 12]